MRKKERIITITHLTVPKLKMGSWRMRMVISIRTTLTPIIITGTIMKTRRLKTKYSHNLKRKRKISYQIMRCTNTNLSELGLRQIM